MNATNIHHIAAKALINCDDDLNAVLVATSICANMQARSKVAEVIEPDIKLMLTTI